MPSMVQKVIKSLYISMIISRVGNPRWKGLYIIFGCLFLAIRVSERFLLRCVNMLQSQIIKNNSTEQQQEQATNYKEHDR